MNTPLPQASNPSVGLKRSHRVLLISLVAVTILGFFLLCSTLWQGMVLGTEFSPTHFQQRSYSYYELPLLRLQLTPIKRNANPNDTATYLRAKKLISVPKGVPQQWQLVSSRRGITHLKVMDAHLLTSYLNVMRDGKYFWKQWSVKHPKQAAVFWPHIQKLAKRELYMLIPDLFNLAQQSKEVSLLTQQMENHTCNSIVQLAADYEDADQSLIACEILKEGMLDFPNNFAISKAAARLGSEPGKSN